ncbi:MAG: hypothetical protein FWF52_10195 [Candidatus Azobacteroides sp.]|nr:hypothetical protein [Candidatus Azobacteroides sp.]
MKKKRKFLVISMFLFSLFIFNKMNAQQPGLYDNDNSNDNTPSTSNEGGSTQTGVFRVGPGGGPGGDPGKEDTPIGEGLLILSVLAGGYAVIKKKKSKIKSNEV